MWPVSVTIQKPIKEFLKKAYPKLPHRTRAPVHLARCREPASTGDAKAASSDDAHGQVVHGFKPSIPNAVMLSAQLWREREENGVAVKAIHTVLKCTCRCREVLQAPLGSRDMVHKFTNVSHHHV